MQRRPVTNVKLVVCKYTIGVATPSAHTVMGVISGRRCLGYCLTLTQLQKFGLRL